MESAQSVWIVMLFLNMGMLVFVFMVLYSIKRQNDSRHLLNEAMIRQIEGSDKGEDLHEAE